jgi:hypothetical protein
LGKKIKNIINVCLCITVTFLFLAGISYSEDKQGVKNGVNKGEREKKEKRKKRTPPEFKYDENSKKYILDTPNFLAEFMPSSFTYTPRLKTGDDKPVTFLLEGFYQGEEKIGKPEASSKLREDNKMLVFDRGDYREVYESVMRGFLQVYVIENLPYKDRDLVIKARLSTEYSLVPNGEEGFHIMDGDKKITFFKQRAVLDSESNSKSLNLKTVLQKDMLTITVPKDYLSKAKFPIVISIPQKQGVVLTSPE